MSSTLLLVLSAFLASAVESVEALTIVLATGIMRGWRSTFLAIGAALLALAALVVIIGPAITTYIPISALRMALASSAASGCPCTRPRSRVTISACAWAWACRPPWVVPCCFSW